MSGWYEQTLAWHWIMDPDGSLRNPDSMDEWANWFAEPKNRIVRVDEVPGARISTMCLGLDTNAGLGERLVFETAVFVRGQGWRVLGRYGTYEQAVAGHEDTMERVKELANRT